MTPYRLTAALAVVFLLLIPQLSWAQDPPAILLEMTLAEDTNDTPGDDCGVSDTLEVGEGAEVEVCYTVTNTGDVALNLHDLEDTELGVLLNDFNYLLSPDASVFLTETVIASTTTTFNGTWTAFNAGPTDEAQDTDSATLTVIPPSITLDVTLTPDTNETPGDECGVESNLTVPFGTDVEVCYTVTNTGMTTLNLHDLEDTELGVILSAFNYELAPGTSTFVTATVNATSDRIFVGTWTAYNAGPENIAEDSDTAFLQVVAAPVPSLGWWSRTALILLLVLFSGMYFMGRRTRQRR